jgi:predicted RNase H-like HicB family nuclease
MQYPVQLQPDGKSVFVTFPDFPGTYSQGASKKDALHHALDALETALVIDYIDAGRPFPTPSQPRRNQSAVELPASFLAKALLLNEMKVKSIRPSALARKLKLSPEAVSRLLNPYRTSSIDRIQTALRVLGKDVEIRAI